LLGQYAENEYRKDFTLSERVAIVNALRSFSHGGDRRSDQVRNGENESLTLADATKRMDFGKDSFYRAKEVVERGTPELVKAMDDERLSINAAHELSKATQGEQLECLTRRFDEGRATARAVRKQLRFIRSRKNREEAEARTIDSPKTSDSIQIHHCPFQELESIAGLEPESARLICTDIPYGDDFVDQIEELAEFSERVLMSGGTFVAYLGHHRFNEKLRALDKHLRFQWISTAVWTGARNRVPRLKLVSKSIPMVVYSKGEWEPLHMWSDTFVTETREKDWHPWQRPLLEVESLVQYFSLPGDLVIDPCGGGFTTAIACQRENRRFVGCDIDRAAVSRGLERLKCERTEPEDLKAESGVEKAIELNGGFVPSNVSKSADSGNSEKLESRPTISITEAPRPTPPIDSVAVGDCRDLIPKLPENSIPLTLTSPPYAERRNGSYPGIPEAEYSAFTLDWMGKLWDKLTPDGSVLIVIDPHVKNGVVADYVLRTQVALRDAGWKQHISLIWHKHDRAPLGRRDWLRHAYEQVLWFSKSERPYCDAWACGTPSKSIGSPKYGHSKWSNGQNPRRTGTARATDVISIPAGATEKNVGHPAMFPVRLAEHLIKTFCPDGDTVLDPFAGSGSTLLAAKRLGRQFYGFDIMPQYVDMAQERLAAIKGVDNPEYRDFDDCRDELLAILEDCFDAGTGYSKSCIRRFFDILCDSQSIKFDAALNSMPRKLRDYYESLPLALAA